MELAKESDEKTESQVQVFSWGEAEPSPLRVSHKIIRNGLGMNPKILMNQWKQGIQWNFGIQRNWKNPKILMNPMKNRGIRGTGGDQME
jgi:hypothetical protein